MRSFDEEALNRKWTCDVPELLALDEVARDLFRNRHHQPNAYRSLFGGQIVAQALAAADGTVTDGKSVHSLHGYFLRAGTSTAPIDYRVERLRDGRRFATRRVTASQHDQPIFTMECSYRAQLQGFSHYRPSGIAFQPETALGADELHAAMEAASLTYTALFAGNYPVEVRIPDMAGYTQPALEAKRHYWLRAAGAERVTEAVVHRQILAFLSDFLLAGAPLARHTIALPGPHLFVASLDHAIWFHREVRCDDWLLFETEGPNAEGGVNLAWGHVYNRAGELVATLAQEALQYAVEA